MAKQLTHTTIGEQLEDAERDQQIIALARAGLPTRRIAERVGCHHATAARVVKRLLDETVADQKEEAHAYRARQVERLTDRIARIHESLEGDPDNKDLLKALATFEALLARITGADRPDVVTATTEGTAVAFTFTFG
jgi:IS30 family transposase